MGESFVRSASCNTVIRRSNVCNVLGNSLRQPQTVERGTPAMSATFVNGNLHFLASLLSWENIFVIIRSFKKKINKNYNANILHNFGINRIFAYKF